MTSENTSFAELAASLGRRALTVSDYTSLIAEISERLREHFRADCSSVLELLPDGRGNFLAGAGWQPALEPERAIAPEMTAALSDVLRTKSPLAMEHVGDGPRVTTSQLLQENHIVSSIFVPLLSPTRPRGFVALHSSERRQFTEEETAQLQVIANIVAFVLIAHEQQQAQVSTKLLRAEQMMAIGQVAAGVAHELRNPLTSIKGLIQLNLRALKERGMPAEDLEIIEQEIRRMEHTLRTFLDFARPPKPNRKKVDLTAICERVLALVAGRAAKQSVDIELRRPERPVTSCVDRDQIQQLILNLILNALDAMPRSGRIEVELHSDRDGFVELTVRDDGPGIAPHILPKVFETFVSGKETGVGLGLPLSKRIAEDHGGTLTAYNLPVSGACFALRLPAA